MTPNRDLAHVTGSYTRNEERVGDFKVLLKAMLKHSADVNWKLFMICFKLVEEGKNYLYVITMC